MKKLILVIILAAAIILIVDLNYSKKDDADTDSNSADNVVADVQAPSMYDGSDEDPFAVNNGSKLIVGEDIKVGTYNLTIPENTYLIVKTGDEDPISYDSTITSLEFLDSQKITVSGTGSIVFDFVE